MVKKKIRDRCLKLEEIERQASGRKPDAGSEHQRARRAAERRHEAEKTRQETATV